MEKKLHYEAETTTPKVRDFVKYQIDARERAQKWVKAVEEAATLSENKDIVAQISADQVAAAKLGLDTRFASLQLNGSEDAEASGHGPGLSMTWDISGKPIGGHKGPVQAFHRLFSKDTTPIEQQKQMLAQKRSVLDTVLENAK